MKSGKISVFLTMAALITGAAIVFFYSPENYPYIPCIFHKVTGLHCPGCGSTRAIYNLLHGNIAQAAKNNLLLFIWGPYVLYRMLNNAMALWKGRIDNPWYPGIRLLYVFIVITIAYTILRNLPLPISTMLAP
jgi:hypothetical protein